MDIEMSSVDDKIKENGLIEQVSIFENEGKLLVKTSDEFNKYDDPKQNQIISTIVDVLLKSNKTEILLAIGLNEDAELTMKIMDNFHMLSLQSQEHFLRKLSSITRKMAELKESEKVTNSEWLN